MRFKEKIKFSSTKIMTMHATLTILPDLSDSYFRVSNRGGDKTRRYFLARISSVGAGFIPARKGFTVD